MSNHSNKIKILGIVLILILCFSTTALDLKYIDTDYGFFTACQNYEVLSDIDTPLEKPIIEATTSLAGSISNCQWKVVKETPKEVYTPVYTTTCNEVLAKNGTIELNCSTTQTGTTTTIVIDTVKTTDFSKETVTKDTPTKAQYCCNLNRQYSKEKGYHVEVDIIPSLSGKTYTEYAWFNSSYFYRHNFNCSNITSKTIPVILNNSKVYINDSNQVIWTFCNEANISIYYNNYDDYIIANSTNDIPFYVERGNLSNLDTSVFNGFIYVYLGNNSGLDSSPNAYHLTEVNTSFSDCKTGKCLNYTLPNAHSDQISVPNMNTSYTLLDYFNFNKVLTDGNSGTVNRFYDGVDNNANYEVEIYPNKMRYCIGVTTSRPCLIPDKVIANNTWYFQANVFNVTNWFSYVDTTLASDTFTGTPAMVTNRLTLAKICGACPSSNVSLDNVMMINRSLSHDEIAQVYNNWNGIDGYASYISTEEQPIIKALSITLDTPLNNTSGTENNTFNYTVTGTNSTYSNCSIYFNGTLNQTAQANNDTLSTFNITGLGLGEWLWNISCWIDTATYNTSETFNYTVVRTTTTTTTVTTTTSGTTTTTYPDVSTGVNPILEMYAIMIPCFAVIFTLAGLHFNKTPLPPIIATILWYAASFWTVNIKYIFDFTTGFRPYYVAAGNPEVGALFMAIGTITGIYAVAVTIKAAADIGYIGGGKKR